MWEVVEEEVTDVAVMEAAVIGSVDKVDLDVVEDLGGAAVTAEVGSIADALVVAAAEVDKTDTGFLATSTNAEVVGRQRFSTHRRQIDISNW
jgi:hypothetical protein